MNGYIYCFDKGLFTKRRFIKALKNELIAEFGELEKDKYVHLNTFLCKVDKSYSSYFSVYEQSNELDRLIDVLIRVSEKYKVTLAIDFSLSQSDESYIVDNIKKQVKNKNITVRASVR